MTQVPPSRYLLRAKDFVDARYAEQITVEDLASTPGEDGPGAPTVGSASC